MDSFASFASAYDLFNDAPYEAYTDYICEMIKRYSDINVSEMLDLGCGTGSLTLLLSERGYDMIGVDASPDMLSAAMQRSNGRILYLAQDMRELDLFGTVQAVVSTYDSFNYLSTANELDEAFARVGNFTEKGGLFIFDISTKYRFESVFGNRSYVSESEGDMLVWQNDFKKSAKVCDFYLTHFEKSGDKYIRSDVHQRQKYFSDALIKKLLCKNGFTPLWLWGGLDCSPLSDTCEKAYYIAKKNIDAGTTPVLDVRRNIDHE